MSSMKIAEAADLTFGCDGRGNDACFEATAADLSCQGGGHGVSGLADGDNEDAVIGIEIVQVVADAQDPALAVHVAGESACDGGVVQRGDENLAGRLAHLAEVVLTFGGQL